MPSDSLARSLTLDLLPNASIRWITTNGRRVDALVIDPSSENVEPVLVHLGGAWLENR